MNLLPLTIVFLSVQLMPLVECPLILRNDNRWYGGLNARAYCTASGLIPSRSLPIFTHLKSSKDRTKCKRLRKTWNKICSLSWRMYIIRKILSYLWSSYGAKHSTTTSRWLFVSETQETDLEPCELVIPLSCVLVICDVLLKLVAFWSPWSFMASDFTLLIESKHKISDWSDKYSISVWLNGRIVSII